MPNNKLEDVGTRHQHLLDLYDTWTTGMTILETFDQSNALYIERHRDLEGAIKLLGYAIEKEYTTDIENTYAATINELPKDATDIK